MSWLLIIVVLAAAYLVFKFFVKPLFKVIGLVALALAAYFWIWPLLMSS